VHVPSTSPGCKVHPDKAPSPRRPSRASERRVAAAERSGARGPPVPPSSSIFLFVRALRRLLALCAASRPLRRCRCRLRVLWEKDNDGADEQHTDLHVCCLSAGLKSDYYYYFVFLLLLLLLLLLLSASFSLVCFWTPWSRWRRSVARWVDYSRPS